MLIEADLYERLTGRVSWEMVLSSGGMFGLPQLCEVGYHLAGHTRFMLLADLKRSYEMREALIQNVGEMIEHPIDSLGNMVGKLKASSIANWKRFRELQKQTDLHSQFEAGQIFGDVLMDVVMLVLTVISVAGAAAKLAAKVPQLVRVAEFIKGARAAEAGGVDFPEGAPVPVNGPHVSNASSSALGKPQAVVPASYGRAIRIDGDERFREKTINSLNQIAATPSGGNLLASIDSSGKTVTIVETKEGNCFGDFSDGAMLKPSGKPGAGSDSKVYFDADCGSIGSQPWQKRPPAIGLAHELIHAEHGARGTIDTTEVQNDHKPDKYRNSGYASTMKEEVRTSGIPPHDDGQFSENKIRSEWNPPQPTRPWY